MRYSQALIPTLREVPADAEVASHQLMLRAGYIRQVARGIYTYLPLGWRVLQNIERIVREELTAVGCQEVQLPCATPSELWEQSGRWQAYGKELLRMHDRHGREYCFGPTHEEVMTSTVAGSVNSYKQLPLHLFQIHTKFRDEIRPRFGLMRGREFIMKDSYSFHADEADLDREYEVMRNAYQRIFTRCGLDSRVVEAATGAIGGSSSHEVMVLAETGESEIAYCECGYTANVELAGYPAPQAVERTNEIPQPEKVHTPGMGAIDEVSPHLGIVPAEMIKTIVYERDEGIVVALIRGDQELNEDKLQTETGAAFLELAQPATVKALSGADIGFVGPCGLSDDVEGFGQVEIIADHSIAALMCGATGANETDYHLTNVVPERDFTVSKYVDLRIVRAGDPCVKCGAAVGIMRGIEVGHIFKLGTKYAEPLGATILNQQGKAATMTMGTYGLGIGRTAAAAIEQHHDEKGVVWPLPIAPYHCVVVLLNNKKEDHAKYAEGVYQDLTNAGLTVLYDDRAERAGVKFADAELIGIPYQVVIGAKGIEAGQVELKSRKSGDATMCSVQDVVTQLQQELTA